MDESGDGYVLICMVIRMVGEREGRYEKRTLITELLGIGACADNSELGRGEEGLGVGVGGRHFEVKWR